jgi:hypothetical protein
VVTVNDNIFVPDNVNHVIHVIIPQGSVRTICGNGQEGYADAQGADAHFHYPYGLVLDAKDNLLVVDLGNHTIRRVTMTGAVSTVPDNGEKGVADGVVAAARFNRTYDLVVNGEGVIVVADCNNHRLNKIVGGQVTTITDRSEPDPADGADVVARFNGSYRLALDEHGRLLVSEFADGYHGEDTLRVVEASLTPLCGWVRWRKSHKTRRRRCPSRRWLRLRRWKTMESFWKVTP